MKVIAWPFVLSILFAIADWMGVGLNIGWLRYTAKPLVITSLVAWLLILPIPFKEVGWFIISLIFALVGDIWLLAPTRFFAFGLGSFLLAQISYVIAFNRVLPNLSAGLVCLAVVIFGLGGVIYQYLHRGLHKKRGAHRLAGGAFLYYIGLSMMLFSAISTLFRQDWPIQPAIYVAVGGLFFFFSDCLLAFDRFIHPVWNGRLIVHMSYHLGQFGLIVGVVWKYLV